MSRLYALLNVNIQARRHTQKWVDGLLRVATERNLDIPLDFFEFFAYCDCIHIAFARYGANVAVNADGALYSIETKCFSYLCPTADDVIESYDKTLEWYIIPRLNGRARPAICCWLMRGDVPDGAWWTWCNRRGCKRDCEHIRVWDKGRHGWVDTCRHCLTQRMQDTLCSGDLYI
jgi:hypothetical protein